MFFFSFFSIIPPHNFLGRISSPPCENWILLPIKPLNSMGDSIGPIGSSLAGFHRLNFSNEKPKTNENPVDDLTGGFKHVTYILQVFGTYNVIKQFKIAK